METTGAVNILAIETATQICSVAVAAGELLLAEETLNIGRIHAEKLAALVDQLLAELGKRPDEIDVLAVSGGPGSFTGLRIGLAFAKGFALAGGQRLILVPTLMALALRPGIVRRPVCPVLRSRRGELYAAVYEWRGSELMTAVAERVLPEEELGLFLPRGALLTGDVDSLPPEIRSQVESREDVELAAPWLRTPSAAAVAQVGFWLCRRGEFADLDTAEPRYLQEFVARKLEGVEKHVQ
jgi:tRNA threonylcarbamoyladenosine biosynthesis protein TsaB